MINTNSPNEATLAASIAPGFDVGPYHVETFNSGWSCVCNARGFNCLTFSDKPGATFTTPENAAEIAKEWNRQ